MSRAREPLILAATGVLALAAPALAARHLDARIAALGPALSELTGEPSRIAGVEAGLTGEVRLTGVEIGDVLRIDAIEASVALDSLLAGDLAADEVRLEGPRLRARVDGAGESNLARILRRVAARRAGQPASRSGGRRLRRIVVTEGDLVLDVVGLGRFEARGVELHPQTGGVRVVTGEVRGELVAGPLAVRASFARGGGDLRLPDARLARFLAVGGTVAARPDGSGGAALEIRGAAAGWNVWGDGVLGLRGDADDGGVPRPILVVASPAARAVHVRGDDLPLGFLAPLAPDGVALGGARASGTVTAARHGAGWTAAIDGTVAGIVLDHGAIADGAVALDGAIGLDLAVERELVTLRSLRLARGALAVDGSGRIRRGGPAGVVAARLDLRLAEASCLDAVAALPAGVRGPLGALVMEGTIGGALRVAIDLDAPPGEAVELGLELDNRCAVLAEPPEANVRALAGVADHRFPDGSTAPVGPGVGDWVAMIALPAHVDGAFVAAEDARFNDHDGFDLEQIARSLEVDLREGRFARGGSTISQQLVKNAFLDHRRTLDRKLQEAILTWRLEAVLSKRQILERYLNVVELGPGVHGVAAAARHWFGKPASALDVKEAAFLAAMTPEPRSMTRRIVAHGGLDPRSAERVETVLRHMGRAGLITDDQRAAARRATLDFRREALAAQPVTAMGTGSGRSPRPRRGSRCRDRGRRPGSRRSRRRRW